VLQAIPIGRYLLNSFVVSTVVVIGQLITASLAAFAFSFVQFRGRTVLFFVFLSTLMIPWEATIIPNYITIRSIGWLDTYQGLVMAGVVMVALPTLALLVVGQRQLIRGLTAGAVKG